MIHSTSLRVPCARCGERITRHVDQPASPRLGVATTAALDGPPPPLVLRVRRRPEEHHCAPAAHGPLPELAVAA
jgi:hypothetical protein